MPTAKRFILATAALAASAFATAARTPFVTVEGILPPAAVEKMQTALFHALGTAFTVIEAPAPLPVAGFHIRGRASDNLKNPMTPVGLVASAPMILVAHTSLPAVESADIIALLKKQPGAKIAHDGAHSASQNCASLLKEMLPTQLVEVVATPGAPPSRSIKSGDVALACLEAPRAIPLIQSGAVNPVFVAGDERLAAIWDVPTAAEVGLPLLSATAWFGLYLADGAHADVVTKANAALQSVLADEKVLQSFTDAGLTPFPLTHRAAEAHAAFAAAEAERGK